MKKILSFVILGLSLLISQPSFAVDSTTPSGAENYKQLKKSEIQKLVEPIALYPDQLLQVILPAATFPDQIVDAGLTIKDANDAKLIKEQNWDTSVKVVASYPGVLGMMYQKIDWTTTLGGAFLNQNEDLLNAIQEKRTLAKNLGNLESNEHQTVKTEKTESGSTVIVVQPANPEVIYVPQSSPTVYTQTSTTSSVLVPLATFGLGLALGAAMNDNDDNHYYYYGGRAGMWYNDSAYHHWADNRRAVWEDYNDRAWDRQDHRQDMAKNRQEFRQDAYNNGNRLSTTQRDQAKQQAEQRRNNAASNNQQAANSIQNRSQSADIQAKRDQARASMNDRGFNGSNAAQRGSLQGRTPSNSSYNRPSSSSGGAFSNYGSRGSTMSASNRGAASSRSSWGSSSGRSSFGGHGGGGGGFSRGGGGGRGGRR